MRRTKTTLQQIIKEEITNVLNEISFGMGHTPKSQPTHGAGVPALSVPKIVSQAIGRSIQGNPVPSDIASDPAYTADGNGLQEGEFGVRGQYIVYRSDGEFRTINAGTGEGTHKAAQALRRSDHWRENENAALPVPEDYVGVRK